MNKYLLLFGLLVLLAAGAFSLAGLDEEPPLPALPPAAPMHPVAQADSGSVEADEYLLSPSYVGEVEFPHALHIDDLEFACDECHHEVNAAALRTPHDDYFENASVACEACHHAEEGAVLEAQACSNCHPSQPGFASDMLSAKVAIHSNCWECHDAGTGAEASETCKDCHTGPRLEF